MNEYWRDFFARAELALLVMAYGLSAAVFFAVFGVVLTWLTIRGYGAFGDVLVLLYIINSLPIFLAQIGLIVDVLLRFIGEAVVVLPALRSVADKTPTRSTTRVMAGLLTTVSPVSSISAWALNALVKFPRAVDLAHEKYRTEASVFQATVRRFRNRA